MKTIFLSFLFLALSIFSHAQNKRVETLKLDPVQFDSDKAIPLSSLKKILKDIDEAVGAAQSYRVLVVGHTDSDGEEAYNLRLSKERASRIYDYLVKQGKDKASIRCKGKGESKPVATNENEEGKSQNRRVEVYVKAYFGDEIQSNGTVEAETEKPVRPQRLVGNAAVSEEIEPNSEDQISAFETRDLLFIQMPDLKQILPEDAVDPMPGCRAFFSGLLMWSTGDYVMTSKVWKEDQYSEYVGSGSYNNVQEAFPKAIKGTFDGLAIDINTHITIYEKPDFKGKVLLDVKGPVIINNGDFKRRMKGIKTKEFKNAELQELFPPENRLWSQSSMYEWQSGSIKIECGQ